MLMRVCSVDGGLFGNNNLGAEGARYLADALRENTALQTLV